MKYLLLLLLAVPLLAPAQTRKLDGKTIYSDPSLKDKKRLYTDATGLLSGDGNVVTSVNGQNGDVTLPGPDTNKLATRAYTNGVLGNYLRHGGNDGSNAIFGTTGATAGNNEARIVAGGQTRAKFFSQGDIQLTGNSLLLNSTGGFFPMYFAQPGKPASATLTAYSDGRMDLDAGADLNLRSSTNVALSAGGTDRLVANASGITLNENAGQHNALSFKHGGTETGRLFTDAAGGMYAVASKGIRLSGRNVNSNMVMADDSGLTVGSTASAFYARLQTKVNEPLGRTELAFGWQGFEYASSGIEPTVYDGVDVLGLRFRTTYGVNKYYPMSLRTSNVDLHYLPDAPFLYTNNYGTLIKGGIGSGLAFNNGTLSAPTPTLQQVMAQGATYDGNMRLGHNLSLGGSGNGYCAIGYGIQYTSEALKYTRSVADYASWIDFHAGGVQFRSAGYGAAGQVIDPVNLLTADETSVTAYRPFKSLSVTDLRDKLLLRDLPAFESNEEALSNGLDADQVYRNSRGDLKVVVPRM